MFNLNDNSLIGGGSQVFNGGIAGKTDNVKVSVTKRASTDPDNQPDYKVFFTDTEGGQINQGFYYHKDNSLYDETKNKANEGYLVGRVLSIAKALVPEDFVFPNVDGKTSSQILDILFKIIRDNEESTTVSIFTNYGTKTKPSSYMNVRYFSFIEKTDTPNTRLKANGNDMMEKLTSDSPATASTAKTTSDW
jgi:hypothetical protein